MSVHKAGGEWGLEGGSGGFPSACPNLFTWGPCMVPFAQAMSPILFKFGGVYCRIPYFGGPVSVLVSGCMHGFIRGLKRLLVSIISMNHISCVLENGENAWFWFHIGTEWPDRMNFENKMKPGLILYAMFLIQFRLFSDTMIKIFGHINGRYCILIECILILRDIFRNFQK